MPTYIRLTDYKSSEEKKRGFFKSENRYEAKQEDFEKIPGSPIAYWVSDRVKEIFEKSKKLGDLSDIKQGMSTANNSRFLRQWFEINFNTKNSKWYAYNKGGDFRKWYGNLEYVIDWENNGFEVKKFENSVIRNEQYFFKEGVTWSAISSSNFGVRIQDNNNILGGGSNTIFIENLFFILGLLSTKVVENMLNIINPTLNFSGGVLEKLPIVFPKSPTIKSKIEDLTQQNIDISKEEWDSRETSWDFRINSLIRMKNEKLKMKSCKIEDAYNTYCDYWKDKFFHLHENEEELNRLFIEIYELENELTPDVPLEDITILKNETKIVDGKLEFRTDEIMKQFISYGVGVMFGRYSLDSEGLFIADLGGETLVSQMIDETKVSFPIDDDNVIPVLEDDYFSDDIASRFIEFVKVTFGEEYLAENIRFIENSLGMSLRKYFVKSFYEDHIKRYKKRPIYWMVASPKKGFMALFYMHRYKSDIFATVQNSYLREYITKLEATKDNLQKEADDTTNSNTQRRKAAKEVERINKTLDEIITFDREVLTLFAQNRVEIDLDDGVKVNYCKFKEVLYPIKGLCKK